MIMVRILPLILTATLGLAQSVSIEPAGQISLSGAVDSNSPTYWWNNRLYLFTSAGMPIRFDGSDIQHLGGARAVMFYDYGRITKWIESVWQHPDGTLYGWYHHEPSGLCAGTYLTAPKIGAVVSYDHGTTFYDLGIVISSAAPPDCGSKNGYFAGGSGDFSVVLDHDQKYFYFYFDQYGGDLSRQGIASARMAVEDLKNPIGNVWKYFNGEWNEPGVGGDVTPTFVAMGGWSSDSPDAFWGPSVHYNRFLGKYVMLLNHSCCTAGWPQEGIYISYLYSASKPDRWSTPIKIMDSGDWYPQVMGEGVGETDSVAGESPRLFIGGESRWRLRFTKDATPQP